MNTATRRSAPADLLASSTPHTAAASVWSQIVDGMPIVIMARAVRDLLRQRAHRQLVLQAFRR